VWVRDATGAVRYANTAAARLFGFADARECRNTIENLGWTLCDEEGAPLARSQFPSSAAFREARPQRRVVGIVAPDRAPQWILVESQPVLDLDGRVAQIVSTASDVTSLKIDERALRVSEERYRRLLETTHEGVCLIGLDSTISFVNSQLCEMVGYEQHEILGRPVGEVLGQATHALFARRRPPSVGRRREVPLRRRDGTTIWAMVGAMPMLDGEGQMCGLLAILDDVTARKLSQERARAAAERIEQLVGDAIYTVDEDGLTHSWNAGAEQLFGWKREEMLGRRVKLVPESIEEDARARILRVISSGKTETLETVRLTKDGRLVEVLGSWSPVALEDGRTGVLCILKDVGSRKAADERLQEQARSLALLRERERIAMDLHDGAIQSLYGVALSLGALRRRRVDEADSAILNRAIDQLTETIHGIRDYIYQLRTGVAEETDLELALKAKADELARQAGVTPHVSIQTDLRRLSSDSAHHLMYIAHEALSNVARHARATDVAVRIVPWRSGMMLSIVDNGRGFDANRKRRRGEGLRNIRERAALLGATLTIDSEPGTGTTVKVQIP